MDGIKDCNPSLRDCWCGIFCYFRVVIQIRLCKLTVMRRELQDSLLDGLRMSYITKNADAQTFDDRLDGVSWRSYGKNGFLVP